MTVYDVIKDDMIRYDLVKEDVMVVALYVSFLKAPDIVRGSYVVILVPPFHLARYDIYITTLLAIAASSGNMYYS